MVKTSISKYTCGKCHTEYNWKNDADKCCAKKQKDWTRVDIFELKQIHLDLLKNMYVSWDDCEFGAPEIDPKRPYGNSDVYTDIAEIIQLPKKDNWDYKEEDWTEETADMMEDLHKQMEVVLQIILVCQQFTLGVYRKKDKYGTKWELVTLKKNE